MKVVWDESALGMKVVLDESGFGMKSDSFIPIWMKVYLTEHGGIQVHPKPLSSKT